MATVTILYASTSGHTEYVTQLLEECWHDEKSLAVRRIRAEVARSDDLLGSDILVLASGTWNAGGQEGHLNLHMHEFLFDRAKNADLQGTMVAIIALGDDRYFYTCRAGEHLRRFVQTHGGEVMEPALLIVNEPYGQEEKIRLWSNKLQKALLAPPSSARLPDESEPRRSALAQPGSAETQ
ncbi:hypothetical protein A3H22_03545 [Candidatus Peribacteria bacterium RIFCSPLOWO2_12_FULL_55_15]|nr:MAG: hypothetical protein A2789_00930 [Candidatus Peribacteria bacterium RIFCSPHIGHO2_01_FULL_54_22]OGJ62197.1 MAG: hypothetical protein A3D12_00045 [Candidatus Peribacteria bacterium RIFCSPHIGHO2_02_FULL_55_24]OGJ69916.1 MAG: hypothetical protein A3H90_00830 [Candidatus Peribacteria bacterium RIFCSPLOWO2_02_FULL_55_36]OGJ72345.1 MAG: hypothetical protein A3H22_03545 [Candidatus Peribacteria bacterium RIFCSPLOWO2_12_FULL_55_15]